MRCWKCGENFSDPRCPDCFGESADLEELVWGLLDQNKPDLTQHGGYNETVVQIIAEGLFDNEDVVVVASEGQLDQVVPHVESWFRQRGY